MARSAVSALAVECADQLNRNACHRSGPCLGVCAIPGAKRATQVEENAATADLPPIPEEDVMARARTIYDRLVRDAVHQRW